jgi:hypothetical protein
MKVRTIRPHDTIEGSKVLGEEYERTTALALQLAEAGVVELVTSEPKQTPKDRGRRR